MEAQVSARLSASLSHHALLRGLTAEGGRRALGRAQHLNSQTGVKRILSCLHHCRIFPFSIKPGGNDVQSYRLSITDLRSAKDRTRTRVVNDLQRVRSHNSMTFETCHSIFSVITPLTIHEFILESEPQVQQQLMRTLAAFLQRRAESLGV